MAGDRADRNGVDDENAALLGQAHHERRVGVAQPVVDQRDRRAAERDAPALVVHRFVWQNGVRVLQHLQALQRDKLSQRHARLRRVNTLQIAGSSLSSR